MLKCGGGVILAALLSALPLAAQAQAKIDFGRDVQPIFKENCYECHGRSQQMRGLRLDRRRDALPNRIGANGARIIPGNSPGSLLYRRLTDEAGSSMPPSGPLGPDQISIIKTWIDQGAEWPDALAGDVVVTRPDPIVVQIMQSLRNGEHSGFQRLVKENSKSLNAKGTGGWTPVMYATLYGDADDVRLLLERGADPNTQNDDGGTALMYAIDDAAKVRLLLDHGATNVDAVSGDGRTALTLALAHPGSADVVKMLLDKSKAVPTLNQAGSSGDPAVLQLVLQRGADTKASAVPLRNVLRTGCLTCFDLLLKVAKQQDLNAALSQAVLSGDGQITQTLLDKGAQSPPGILTNVALSGKTMPLSTIQTLIDRGADVNFIGPGSITVLDLASRHGNKALIDALHRAGAKEDSPASPRLVPAKPAASAREAIERSLPPLQRADATFFDRAGCISCHNNSLTAVTVAAARAKGFRVDENVSRTQLQRFAAFLQENRERALEDLGLPGGVDTVSYVLLGMAAEKYPSDWVTDAWARYLKNRQTIDGHWECAANRPPIESSDLEVTAASIKAIRTYGSKSQRAAYERSAQRAVQWLESAQPGNTEDHTFKVLGLVWGGARRSAIGKAAQALLTLQQSDGGWAQLPSLSTDAYATGQALVALHESGALPVSSPAYQRGVRFLLNSQLEDGSWYVQSRALPVQPYFDSGFPHGHDQFISAAATNWAAMALIAGRD